MGAKRTWLDAHHDVTRQHVDAIVESIALEKKDPDLAVSVLKKYLSSDDDASMRADYELQLSYVPALPYPLPEQFPDMLAVMEQSNPALQGFDVSQVLDASFVQSAADRGVDKS